MYKFLKLNILLLLAMGSIATYGQTREQGEWVVISVYPEGGVYQQSLLKQLVSITQNAWKVKDSEGRNAIKIMDNIATENTIVGQGDTVRFRRLIDQDVFQPGGLSQLQGIVNEHPVLNNRLADEKGEAFHVWVKLARPYSEKEKSKITNQLMASLGSVSKACLAKDDGPLADFRYTEWTFLKQENINTLETYQRLQTLTKSLQDTAWASYSVTDLISVLNDAYQEKAESELTSSDQVEQLYMIAESLRSRHLHHLSSPDFRRVKLVVIDKDHDESIKLSGFSSKKNQSWKASDDSYFTLDCRSASQVSGL